MVLLFFYGSLSLAQNISVSRNADLMGSKFSFTIIAEDSIIANQHIDDLISEMNRIENLISEWKPETQISEVNRMAGKSPVKVDREVFELTKRAIQYSKMTDGAFDISIVAMDKVWKFDDSMTEIPSSEMIAHSIRNVGFQHIVLDSIQSSIYLTKPGMKIGFGSIGKGYAADKGRELMLRQGVIGGIVNASGDIATWGKPLDDEFWKIGIKNPFKKNKSAKILKFQNNSVATSGSYEKFAEINNVRYSHIINPKTGIPATGLTSVTISGPSTEFANALSTSIMVLGHKKGRKLLKKHPDYQYILITDKGRVIKN